MNDSWVPKLFSSSKPVKEPVKPKTKYEQFLAGYEALPVEVRILSTLFLGSASTLGLLRFHKRYLRRYPTHGWITPDLYAQKRWIKGVVTRQVIRNLHGYSKSNRLSSVGDPDGFRLYHTPGFVWYWRLKGIPNTPKGVFGYSPLKYLYVSDLS